MTSQYDNLKVFVEALKANPSKAWQVQIGNKVKKNEYFATASYKFLSDHLGIATNTLQGNTSARDLYTPLMSELNQVLIEQGVLIKGEIASALELRRNAINWWHSLSKEDKSKLDTFGNSIRFKKYLNNWRGGKNYKIVTELGEAFNKELITVGVLKDDYVPVKGRSELLDKSFIEGQKQSKQRWEYLRKLQLETVDDLLDPKSSDEEYLQLKQLVAVTQNKVASDSGRSNFRDAFVHLSSFLCSQSIEPSAPLVDILNEYLLVRFYNDYIQNQLDIGKISPASAPTIVSSIRGILKRAKSIKGLDFSSFYDTEAIVRGRVTDTYKPYSKKEREIIHKAISSEIREIKELLLPYKKSGLGQNPLDQNHQLTPGLSTEDNARYIFENKLNCIPIFHHTAKTIEENAFLSIVGKLDIGLHELYKKWRVLPIVSADIVAPFVFRLAQITGMNADPIADLNVDDLVIEHQATGRACLRYWKERSTGGKELHLDLFEAKLQWLTKKQSTEVKDIFDTILMLTKSIRSNAPEEVKNTLFIFQSVGQRTYGKITSFAITKSYSIYSNFVKRNELTNEKGEPLKFTLTRFRPSFVSELVEAGVSIREIQLMLGHGNIETTMAYLDRLDFNRIARQKLKDVLNKIHSKVIIPSKENKAKDTYLDNKDRVIFTTPLSGCANVFDPPDFIKNSNMYKKGQPCSQYNKCLSCDNVMLIAEHLPMLFAMRRDYLILMQRNRIMETPYGFVFEENLMLLDEILNPKTSDFTEDELLEGERLAIFEETAVIDGVTA